MMQVETHICKAMPKNLPEPQVKHELSLARMSSVTQLSEKDVGLVLSLLSKAIGYYLVKE